MARFTHPAISDGLGIAGIPVQYTPSFTATGLTYTGSGLTHPCYNSFYVKNGHQVSFYINVNLSTVTSFGTGQFKLELPFTPHDGSMNHFLGWVWVDPSQPADQLNGHIQLVGDHLPASKILDLHWLGGDTPNPKPVIEHLFYQGYPVTITTASKLYISGTYISAA